MARCGGIKFRLFIHLWCTFSVGVEVEFFVKVLGFCAMLYVGMKCLEHWVVTHVTSKSVLAMSVMHFRVLFFGEYPF